MIGHGAGNRRRTLDDVQPIHLRAGRLDTAPIREIARVTNARRAIGEKIAVERDDNGGLIEAIDRIHIVPEGEPRSRVCPVVAARFVRLPLWTWELCEQGSHLR